MNKEIREQEARLERKRERLANLRRAKARFEAGTLEDFEQLGSIGQRRIYEADPDLYRRHVESIQRRNERRFLGLHDD